LWLADALAQGPGTSVTPVDGATDTVVGYLLGYGPLGICFVAVCWLWYRGYRLMSPQAVTAIREEGRADLITERDRILGEKHAAEQQRDEASKIARDLAPLLSSFIASTGALIPILQGIIADGRRRGGGTH
jgi:hypothetical protein